MPCILCFLTVNVFFPQNTFFQYKLCSNIFRVIVLSVSLRGYFFCCSNVSCEHYLFQILLKVEKGESNHTGSS